MFIDELRMAVTAQKNAEVVEGRDNSEKGPEDSAIVQPLFLSFYAISKRVSYKILRRKQTFFAPQEVKNSALLVPSLSG